MPRICFTFVQLPCVKNSPAPVAVPEPSLPEVKPPACVNAEDSDAKSLPLSCELPAVVNPTRFPPAIAAWNDAFTPPPLVGRTRKVPSSQPSCSVVLTTLWARISSGPFSCGLLLVAVPAYVAVVSLYVPSLPVHVFDRVCETSRGREVGRRSLRRLRPL